MQDFKKYLPIGWGYNEQLAAKIWHHNATLSIH